MDYGFAPGNTGQDGRVRRLFQRRTPPTTLVANRNMAALHEFVAYLSTSSAVTRPIGNILLGTHANSEGRLFMPMYRNQAGGATSYETFAQTLTQTARSIDVPAAVTQGFVHIKGCNIGKNLPFLTEMRRAMGGRVSITAPRHFDGIYEHSAYGSWEFMDYEFTIRNPVNLTRNALIAAFQNATPPFRFVDGTAVPAANWANWIPTNIKATSTRTVQLTFGQTIGKRTTIGAIQQFRVERLPFIWSITYPKASDVPAPAQRAQAIQTSMQADPTFATTHPFPTWVRYGYSSFPNFFAGYTWHYTARGRVLQARGTRTKYTLVIPIVASGHLVSNFFPLPTTSYTAFIDLNESDALFFGKVP